MLPMRTADAAAAIRAEVGKAIVGQSRVVDQVLTAIFSDGHVLLEGAPGLAKTLLVRALAKAMSLEHNRVQFTPDLMPTDVVGTNVFSPKTAEFALRKGPIFTSILLADEINRTPPKTQSALLEAMQERQVTIDGERLLLPFPFLVFATQNPLEFEGTYPLPEAQQDRFLLKVLLTYPEPENEIEVIMRHHQGFKSQNLDEAGIQPVMTADDLRAVHEEIRGIAMEDKIFHYIYQLVAATRNSPDILVGASPRAGIAMLACAKTTAAMRGRDFVTPDDVKEMALPILRHRILLRPETEIEGLSADQVLQTVLDAQVVPR